MDEPGQSVDPAVDPVDADPLDLSVDQHHGVEPDRSTVNEEAEPDHAPLNALPIAVINGKPLLKTPENLYIPPDALEIFLETFEGPLDLLLFLIKQQNIDILDIPIAAITHQYVAYIDMMENVRIELAADYLVMAAVLAEIKSRLLLPRPASSEEGDEDPRAELMRRLQEYEQFKRASESLDAMPRSERDIFPVVVGTDQIVVEKKQPEVSLDSLLTAFAEVLKHADQLSHHTIQQEPLSVRERMVAILERLNTLERNADRVPFFELFTDIEGRSGAVVSLLAILELCKSGLIDIFQAEPLAELFVVAGSSANG